MSRPLHDRIPAQLGLRSCLCHNGLLGANIATLGSNGEPHVYVQLARVKHRVGWSDAITNRSFEEFFRGHETSEVLILKRLLSDGIDAGLSFLGDLRADTETNYGGRERFETFRSANPIQRSGPNE